MNLSNVRNALNKQINVNPNVMDFLGGMQGGMVKATPLAQRFADFSKVPVYKPTSSAGKAGNFVGGAVAQTMMATAVAPVASVAGKALGYTGKGIPSLNRNIASTNKTLGKVLSKYDVGPAPKGFVRTYHVIAKGKNTPWRFGNEADLRRFIGSQGLKGSEVYIQDLPAHSLNAIRKGVYTVKNQYLPVVQGKSGVVRL